MLDYFQGIAYVGFIARARHPGNGSVAVSAKVVDIHERCAIKDLRRNLAGLP